MNQHVLHRLMLLACLAALWLAPPVLCRAARVESQDQATQKPAESFLDQFASTNRFRLGQPGSFAFTPDETTLFFLRSQSPRSFTQELRAIDLSTLQERLVLTAPQLLAGDEESLTPEEKARRERARSSSRGISSFQLSKDGSILLVPLSGRLFLLETSALLRGEVAPRELKSELGPALDPRLSPDAKHVACVRSGDLYVTELATGIERRITPGARGTVSYAEAEFVAQEEMDRFRGYWWSPKSDMIVYQRTDVAGLEQFTIADAFDPAGEARSWPYPRAGRKNADVSLWMRRPSGEPAAPVLVQWDRAKYPYLARVTWSTHGPLSILVQNRMQTEQVLLRVDAISGATRELLRERDTTWLNLDPSPHWIDDGNAFYWATEQAPASPDHPIADGWALERRDAQGDRLLLARPRCAPRSLVKASEDGTRVFLTAHPDPTQTSVFTCAIEQFSDGTSVLGEGVDLASLTPPPATGPGHHAFTLSENATLAVHAWSMLSGEQGWRVERYDPSFTKGEVLCTVESKAEAVPFTPRVELVTLDDVRSIRCAIIRPRDFDPARKYPVLDFAYAGPHAKTVHANARSYIMHQWYADQGFIVVCIDGRGTPDRGHAWERAIHRNLIDASLEDHVDALRALCARHPEMDSSRIGVNGWSFGGYFSAMAVMRRPDIYKAGVAGAPVADWRDYDTHYTERYMGMPLKESELTDGVQGNLAGYNASSVITYADKLSVPLLIIHGTADDNVYIVHSFKLADALNKAGKHYDFLPLPGQTHAISRPDQVRAVQGRIAAFLKQHLLQK